MNLEDLNYYYNKLKFGEDNYHNMMQVRVNEILLVSNIYDSYVLEKDGRLSEQIYGEYRQLDLSMAPRITTATATDDIISMLKFRRFDLIIIMMKTGGMTPFDLSRQIKEMYPRIPLLLLLNKQSYIEVIQRSEDRLQYFDDIFMWKGDAKLFIAMIKSVEDRLNVAHDTLYGHVRVILVVESNVDYYSIFLPIFYSESMKLTQELIDAELQDANKRLRMRARPKILLSHNYNDALEYYNNYREFIICVITNVNLKVNGKIDSSGGIRLIRKIRQQNPDVPVMIQSADPYNRIEAGKLNAEFIDKSSRTLLADIRQFVVNNLGFGDFIFRNEKGEEIDRAKSMYHFEKKLETIPEESLLYHANHNHFSAWLMAHGEIRIAQQIRYVVATDFLTTADLRRFIITTIRNVRQQKNRGKVIKFDPSVFTEDDKIVLLADGSLGGKGRGLSFLNALMVTMDLNKEFSGVTIKLPRTAIIGTNEFDRFLELNRIDSNRIIKLQDSAIENRFLQGRLSDTLKERLQILLSRTSSPLAIRSSGLLEDSQSQPFAGIYQTFMLPNNHSDPEVRLRQLSDAIKIIFSTPFQHKPRKYIESIHYNIEEEKMAVVIQEIAGSTRDNHFFPLFSGAAQSYNFYPTSVIGHADGVVALAAGLGKAVVDGERSHRYSPRHPKIDLLEPVIIVENNQRDFYAIDLERRDFDLRDGELATLQKIKITQKQLSGIFKELTSVWDYENFVFVDGRFAQGPRVITFRNYIHFDTFPLSAILLRILDIGEVSLGVPVEIEFAVDFKRLEAGKEPQPVFYLLQIRPLSVTKEYAQVEINEIRKDDALLVTSKAMGNGIIRDIEDVVFIDPEVFDNRKTLEIVKEIEQINLKLRKDDREYLLIGPGRWGTSDRFLGIPVNWTQIDKARIIVETNLKDFVVEASQGSHFFHNLVAMNVGYFTVAHNLSNEYIDWEWLKAQPMVERTEHVYHSRVKKPLLIKIDGRSGRSVILKQDKKN